MTPNQTTLQAFIDELSGFACVAESTLKKIESDMETHRPLFSVFSERMIAIRGTADQLALPEISHLAGLGEEIAVKAVDAPGRPQIRKCVGALWDALTTIKHLLVHHGQETDEERGILINRLEATLKALGGKRDTFNEDEISQLILARDEGTKG